MTIRFNKQSICGWTIRKTLQFATVVVGIATVTSDAFATGYLMPGVPRGGESQYDEWDSPDSISIPGVVDNSFYCRSSGLSGIDLVDFSPTITPISGTAPTVVFRGNVDGLGNQEGAFAFIANVTGAHTGSIAASSFGTGSGSSALSILECFNTTLFGSFNTVTAANPVNFLELTNISTASIDARIVLKGFSGTELARTTQTIAAGQRVDIAVHSLDGASNTFGSITVAHDGPLGGLTGNVSKYKFDGTTLDITATEPLRARVQK